MFNLFESSRARGTPLTLFRFDVAGQTFAYCNGDDDYAFGGVIYVAAPIAHGRINSKGGSVDRATLDVNLADTLPIAAVLRGYPLSSVMTLVIRQGHRLDGDMQFLVSWAGRVLSAKGGEPGERVLSCQPVTTSLKRSGLRRNWQYPCPHVLYGDQCRASFAAATVTTVPTNAVRNLVTVPAGWNARPVDKYAGGIVTWGAEVRTILRATATTLTLGGPATFAPGTPLAVSLGCNHLLDDCRGLHVPAVGSGGQGNVHNFGGQPLIPTQSPIGFVSNY